MTKVVIRGTRANGEEFRKEVAVGETKLLLSYHLTELDLTPLEKCTELQKLSLRGNKLTRINLMPLKKCTELQELNLGANQFASLDLAPLQGCTKLHGLYLYDNQFASLDLSPLQGCTNLQELRLDNNQLASLDLAPLQGCPELQKLNLSANQFASLDLAPLQGCTKLHGLYLSANQFASLDLSPLQGCPELQKLNLSGNQLASLELVPLEQCTKLQLLYLYSNRLASLDLAPLQGCTELQKFRLDKNQLTELDLAPLQGCPELQKLYLHSNRLTAIDLSPLRGCSELLGFTLDSSTTIRWDGPSVPPAQLPEGLRWCQYEIQQAQEDYLQQQQPATTAPPLPKLLLPGNFRKAVKAKLQPDFDAGWYCDEWEERFEYPYGPETDGLFDTHGRLRKERDFQRFVYKLRANELTVQELQQTDALLFLLFAIKLGYCESKKIAELTPLLVEADVNKGPNEWWWGKKGNNMYESGGACPIGYFCLLSALREYPCEESLGLLGWLLKRARFREHFAYDESLPYHDLRWAEQQLSLAANRRMTWIRKEALTLIAGIPADYATKLLLRTIVSDEFLDCFAVELLGRRPKSKQLILLLELLARQSIIVGRGLDYGGCSGAAESVLRSWQAEEQCFDINILAAEGTDLEEICLYRGYPESYDFIEWLLSADFSKKHYWLDGSYLGTKGEEEKEAWLNYQEYANRALVNHFLKLIKSLLLFIENSEIGGGKDAVRAGDLYYSRIIYNLNARMRYQQEEQEEQQLEGIQEQLEQQQAKRAMAEPTIKELLSEAIAREPSPELQGLLKKIDSYLL